MRVFNIANGGKMAIDLESIKLIVRQDEVCITVHMLIRPECLDIYFDNKEDADIFFNAAKDDEDANWDVVTDHILAYEGVIISIIEDKENKRITYVTEDGDVISEFCSEDITDDELHERFNELVNMIFKKN